MTSSCLNAGKLRWLNARLVMTFAALVTSVPMFMTMNVHAQDAGPMRPPEAATIPRQPSANQPEQPAIPPEEMIRRFAAKEDEMARAAVTYGFERSVRLEEIGPDNKPAGQLEIVTQRIAGVNGKLYEKPVRRTESTMHVLQIERGDSGLVAATPLFPLTSAQLPRYEIAFEGKQALDELSVYIFAVKPRALDRSHAYFSGVVWVDEQDFVIVKTMGKWVTETGDVTSGVLPFSVFETYRQQVGKNLWLPAYSRSDDTFSDGKITVPIRITIRWTGYTVLPGTPPDNAPGARTGTAAGDSPPIRAPDDKPSSPK